MVFLFMLVETKLVTSSDDSFLKDLFFEIKSDVFRGMSKKLQGSLLNLQFYSQQQHYGSQWPDAEHKLLIHNNMAVGQVIVDKSDVAFHIVDISILPSFQKQGIGTQYLLSLIEEVKAQKLSISLTVDKNNHALTLYKRLGFKVVTDDLTHYTMEINKHC